MIVRLFKENFVKFIDESNPEDVQIDAYLRHIDTRERMTDKENYRPTPFPYLEKGVVIAVSPELQLAYALKKEQLQNYSPSLAKKIAIPAVGDVVEVRTNYSSVWFKEQRYYPDRQRQCMDFVRNQTELRLNNFEGYFWLEEIDYFGLDQGAERKGFYKGEAPEWYTQELDRAEETLKAINEQLEALGVKAPLTPSEMRPDLDESSDSSPLKEMKDDVTDPNLLEDDSHLLNSEA